MAPIHWVSLLASSPIFAIIVRGTESNIPTGPRTKLQNTMVTTMIEAESPRPRSRTLGSITLPTTVLTNTKPAMTTRVSHHGSSSRKATITAGMAAMSEPTFGM